jgi:peptidoglycan/LPS O-acetylase OafA/YrhL
VTNLFGVPMQYRPLWSLAVEEHFYLLWPGAVRLFPPRKLVYAALAVFFGCPLLRAIAFRLKYDYGSHYTWLVADGLAAGAVLALLCRWWSRDDIGRFSMGCVGAALVLAAIGLPYGVLRSTTLLGGSLRLTILNLFFTGMLGETLLVGTSSWKWLVRKPSLQFFGDISYGLYLIHVLVFDLFNRFQAHYFPDSLKALVARHFALTVLRFCLAAGVAVACALLSRRTLEAHFLRLKDRWTSRTPDSAPAQIECETADSVGSGR